MNENFNIVILGVGGQGLMTLLRVLSQAALSCGFDVKTSELHGLSQRGGSVNVHIRFGEKACPESGRRVWSPLVPQGQADLVIALEQQESLNGLYFANKNSVFLINEYETPTMAQTAGQAEIENELKKMSNQVFFLPASQVCQKELGNEVVCGVYFLGYALKNGYLPLKKENIIEAIKKTISEKYQELNIKALNLP